MGVADGEGTRPEATSTNQLSGGTVHGGVVQAGVVHGNVTLNYQAGRMDWPRPDQVPLPPRAFVNQVRVRGDLTAQLAGDSGGYPIAALSGLSGIGKTSTACRWAHDHQEQFPDGQVYIDFAALRGGNPGGDVSEALAMCLRSLGVREEYLPAGLAERTMLYRSHSSGRRLLVVLDDVTQPAQVRALVPQGKGSALLVTSARRLDELAVDGVRLFLVDPLDQESAIELLAARCGRARIEAEPEAAAALVELCDGLPIALSIVGARLAVRQRLTLAALAAELADEQSRLKRISVTGSPEERTVAAALELSYRELSEAAGRLYRLLGLLPVLTFDAALAGAASGTPESETLDLLAELESAGMLVVQAEEPWVADGERYRLHGLVRLHARESARTTEAPNIERLVVERAVGYYLVWIARADLAIRADRLRILDLAGLLGTEAREVPEGSGRAAVAWLEAERANVMAVLRAAVAHGFDRQVWQLAEVFTVLFLHHRHLADWRESLELGAGAAGRAAEQAAQTGDSAAAQRAAAAEARLRSLLSRPLLDLGRDEQALIELETAAQRADEAGDLVLAASVQEFTGRYWERHDPERAMAAYRAALALNLRAAEQPGEASVFGTREAARRGAALARYFLGCAERAAGRDQEALVTLREARDELLGIEDTRMAARALAELGRVHADLGDLEAAVMELREAAAELHDQRAGHYEALALEDLAALLTDRSEAADCLRRALAIHEAGGSPRAAELTARLAAEAE
ncbi:hypothetical protein CFP65_0355 [Kitasatospora sp. MMS16-BH015]|uniref:NB-ARC domain-containing protein n=1 Tax=Kitasatospora sp. MMS16-BH015 TaxID=2018025 RepID=UPI000CA0A711|nr:NB-ARC domain-containing protein [Kitasatospora sp. MMS16-BH015]AUG75327.1 hypothetical protein CFP65_0355 [Kitasatospora sp. MMS16-BH015]